MARLPMFSIPTAPLLTLQAFKNTMSMPSRYTVLGLLDKDKTSSGLGKWGGNDSMGEAASTPAYNSGINT